MFEIILLTAALVSIVVLYKFLPNRKVFVCFCASMMLMFLAGAFFGLQTKSDSSIDEAQRDARLRQEKFFIDWYSEYQRDIEQLDRNWQLYHSLVDGYREGKSDLVDTFERLQELDPDDELFLKDTGNHYGANWHSFVSGWDMFEEIEDEEDY